MIARRISWKRSPSLAVIGFGLALAGIAAGTARAGDAVDLQPVEVTGTSGYQTESTGSYRSDLVSVGEKDARPVREIPQSTTVLTREYLDDRGATSLDTALRHTPGIVVLDNDNGRSSLDSRGFEFDSLYFDGLPAPLSSIYGTQPDLAIVDHVEILRGPAGLFGGAGEPAGAINMHLKQPTTDFQGSAAITGGSYGNIRGDADVSTPLTDSGSVRSRVVLSREHSDGWVKNNDSNSAVGYGTIQGDIDPLTTATLTFSHLERDITPYNGLPTYANGKLVDVDRTTTTGARWNDFSNEVNDYIGEVEHRFADGGHAKVGIRYSDRQADFLYGYAATAANAAGVVNGMRWLARDYDETSLSADAHVSKPFTLFGQEHNILIGTDYREVDSQLKSGTGVIAGSFNLNNWNMDVAHPAVTYSTQTDTKLDQYGLYGQLRIQPVNKLTLIGGARSSWYHTDATNLLTGRKTTDADLDAEVTPYGGITYDILPQLTAYTSYTAIFQPQTDVDVNGKTLDPREGRQYEGGLKSEFLDRAASASLAYFNLHDKNRSTTDNLGNYVAQGEVSSEGMEFEASGNLTPDWQVMGGYTYTVTEYLNGVNAGTTFAATTPKHMVQVWSKYRPPVLAKKLSLGVGVKSFSGISAISAGQTIKADGYQVLDLQAGYDIRENLEGVLTVSNVTDEKYYSRVGGTTVFNFYGQPRTVLFSLKARF